MKLALYHYDSCPFCRMVRHAIDGLGLDVELRNIHESGAVLSELVEATGRRMVPCLRIEPLADGADADPEIEWMHESRDIIRYLTALP